MMTLHLHTPPASETPTPTLTPICIWHIPCPTPTRAALYSRMCSHCWALINCKWPNTVKCSQPATATEGRGKSIAFDGSIDSEMKVVQGTLTGIGILGYGIVHAHCIPLLYGILSIQSSPNIFILSFLCRLPLSCKCERLYDI